jgi:hypothetical protein
MDDLIFAININQIFGIETGVGGTLFYITTLDAYISFTSHSGIIFDNKRYYRDSGNSGTIP